MADERFIGDQSGIQSAEDYQLSVMERMRNTRAGRFLTGTMIALSSVGGAGTALMVNASPAGAEEASPTAPANLDTTCFEENLVLPTNVSASMINAGVKADISNPNQPDGSWQTSSVTVHYPAVSQECAEAGYMRIGRTWMQITYKDQWRSFDDGWKKTTYSRDIEGDGGNNWSPTGHEGAWYYWNPGDRVRAKFDTVVKSPTGKTEVSPTKTVRVKVQR